MLFLIFALIHQSLSISPSTWIGDSLGIIGELTLKNLTIPGTHDSGTYYLTETPLPGSISPLDDILLLVAERLDRSFG